MKHTKELPPQLDPLKREHVHPQSPKPAAVEAQPKEASEQTETPAEVQDENVK